MIATEYAKSLFDVHPNLDLCLEEYDCFKEFYNELSPLMLSPNITNEDKKEVINKSLKNFTKEFIYFIYVIIDNNRFREVLDIYNEFVKLYYKKNNIALVDVCTKNELKVDEKKKLVSFLEEKLGMEVKLNIVLDENILGLKVVYNGNVIDYTVSSLLEKMRFSL